MQKNKIFVYQCAQVAALGSLLFGFDTAVISGTTEALQKLYDLSDGWLGFTVASALLGTIAGSILVGWPADRIGRRNMLVWTGVLYLVSALGCALAWDWYSLLVFRFIGGLGVGGASVLSPIYIAEISPAESRGRLVALAQFNIVLGILLAYVSNYVVTLFDFGDVEWRWMFGVEALPAAVFTLLLFGISYSPRWLMAKGRKQEAMDVLCLLEGSPEIAQAELLAIQESLDLEHHSLRERFYSKKYLKLILLACAIAAFNQLSGINALIYYAPKIFKMAGAAGGNALVQSVIIGLVNLVFTVAAMRVIDHFGRKKLMLVGSIGYIFSLGLASYAFFTYGEDFTQLGGLTLLGALVLFIASHAFGQGTVVWVFISEIFPNRVRARGQAVGAFTVWVFNAAVSQTFPMVAGQFGGGVIFAVYGGFMVLQLLWVIFLMPETKGVPLEDIQKHMGIE